MADPCLFHGKGRCLETCRNLWNFSAAKYMERIVFAACSHYFQIFSNIGATSVSNIWHCEQSFKRIFWQFCFNPQSHKKYTMIPLINLDFHQRLQSGPKMSGKIVKVTSFPLPQNSCSPPNLIYIHEFPPRSSKQQKTTKWAFDSKITQYFES